MKKTKLTIKKKIKQRTPHKPTRAHRDRKKYTRKGRESDRRRKEILKDLGQGKEE